MTTQTTELQAGRELDALIAEKVMGFAEIEKHDDGFMLGFIDDRRDVIRCPVPDYSTDIAAAWQVVEKFHSWSLSMNSYRADAGEPQFYADLVGMEGRRECWASVFAPTAPLAICRAALKAVGK